MLRRNGPSREVRGASPEAGRESMGERFVEEVGGQTAGWMKLVLGTEVGHSPGDFLLDGDWGPSSPPPKGGQTRVPNFGPFLLWPNGWTHQDATWYGCRPQLRGLCVRWRPSPPPPKGSRAPQIFGPCLLWPNGWMVDPVVDRWSRSSRSKIGQVELIEKSSTSRSSRSSRVDFSTSRVDRLVDD